VIQVRHDQEIPCDCLCIAAPSDEVEVPGGTIYMRTENLDGEMDLKAVDIIDTGLTTDRSTTRDVIEACRGFTLNYPPPSPSLHEFDANFFIGQETRAVFPKHMLLQSAYLKNIRNIFAVVIFTGNETRCGMNKKPAPQKWAALDQCVSRYSILIFICQMITAFSLGIAGFLQNRDDDTWYLALSKGSTTELTAGGIIYPLRFFLLTSVMIPISFKFIVDVSKYWMALVLEWDLGMWDDERKEGMRVKNSSIVEDLAQIQYVLSDKTGTLTQNIMSMHSWSTGADALYKISNSAPSGMEVPPPSMANSHRSGGRGNNNNGIAGVFSATANARSAKLLNDGVGGDGGSSSAISSPACPTLSFRNRVPSQREDRANLVELLVAMAITNTVSVNDKFDQASPTTGGKPVQRYTSPSPDEECLCAGAAAQGVTLERRSKTHMTIHIEHTASRRSYQILQVFEFSSDRKCMSIVLREEAATTASSASSGVGNATAAGADVDADGDDLAVGGEPPAAVVLSGLAAAAGAAAPGSSPGQLWLYTKGADDRILSMLAQESRESDRVAQSMLDVNHFAHSGLRTLFFARRRITSDEYREFEAAYQTARTALSERQDRICEVQAGFEKGVTFLGASGVEDKLQEDVQGTVRRILNGNVKFWMLTGDKVETAKQIAVSCGLFTSSVVAQNSRNCIEITGQAGIDKLRKLHPREIQLPAGYAEAQEAARVRLHPLGWCSTPIDPKGDGSGIPLLGPNAAGVAAAVAAAGGVGGHGTATSETGMHLVVEGGRVLDQILKDEELAAKLFAIATRCVAVVCARVTPAQKAAVTHRVKEMGNMTLSIGDGGNDVAMIQESHVGVGILGREGQMAARAADFAIVNFKDLATLMFVHGHMSYMRTSYIVLYSFYKSMLISAIQVMYNIFFAKLSGVSFWNSFVLTMWNGAFTLPQTICFVLDRCVPREILVRYPLLYRLTQDNYGFTAPRFFSWLGMGFAQSAGLLLLVWLGFGVGEIIDPATGRPGNLGTDFTAAYTAVLMLQVPLVCIYSSSVTWINAFWIFAMPAGYAALMAIYSLVKRVDYYGTWFHAENTPYVLWVFIVALVLFLPCLLQRTLAAMVAPNAATLLRRSWVSGDEMCSSKDRNTQLYEVRTASRPALAASTGRFSDPSLSNRGADLEHHE
jgi:magnesium-transporting ATPase (P-type)